jgi:hypothetical protein
MCGVVLLEDPTLAVLFPFWPPLFESPASPLLEDRDLSACLRQRAGEARGVVRGLQVVTEDFQC